jgi:hypothetical protein
MARRNQEVIRSISRQAQARNPQAGTPEPDPGYAYDIRESPAHGTDNPPEDYTAWGMADIPAEGFQGPDLAGPPVVPQRLGRARGSLGRLSTLAQKERNEADRQRVIMESVNTLHTLAGRAGGQFSDRGYLEAGRDALRQLSESGGILIHEDGSISSQDIGEENDPALKTVLENMRDRWQSEALLGNGQPYPGPARIMQEQ